MLVSGLRNESLANLVSGSDVKLADVHKSLRECAQAIRDRYQQKQAKNTVKRRIKTHAIEVLLEELSTVPEDSAAIREKISSALERHAEALRNHEHLLSKKGNTYALLQQTKGLRMGHGDAPAELASLLEYHDLKDKLTAFDAPLGSEGKALVRMFNADKVLTLEVLKSIDKRSCAEKTGRVAYVYDHRSFPLHDSSYDSATVANFTCVACKNIMNQPRQVCLRQDFTCLACAKALQEDKNSDCPGCGKTLFAKFRENKEVEKNIDKLQVYCCNTGCKSIMQISEIKNHLDLCKEEKVECPGKCTDESTGKVLCIPRKQLADHSKECPKHFKCDKCNEHFPNSLETKYLEHYQAHMSKHGTDQNVSTSFVTSVVGELLSRRELPQKRAATRTERADFTAPLTKAAIQTGRAEFQVPFIKEGRIHRFAGTDCVTTPQNGVYQSLTDPRDFFVTMEVPPGKNFHRMVVFRFQEDVEGIGKAEIGLEVNFRVENTYVRGGDSKIFNVNASPGVYMKFLERRGSPCSLKHIHVACYTGSNQQMNRSGPIMMRDGAEFDSSPYEGNQHLFKIMI